MQNNRTGELVPWNGTEYPTSIPEQHRGPSFEVDEELVIKGGRFKVSGFEGGFLHLVGIPKGKGNYKKRIEEVMNKAPY